MRRRFLAIPTVATTALALSAALLAPVSAAEQQPASPPATQPTSRPAALPADSLLNQMLRPDAAAQRPLTPAPQQDVRDATSGRGATAPNAPAVPLMREGTFLVDRTGRLTRLTGNDAPTSGGGPAAAGGAYQFVFDADGRTLKDPPVLILPNLKLQTMEDAVRAANRDLRFRITGVITEYRGRNAVLIEKVVVIPDAVQGN